MSDSVTLAKAIIEVGAQGVDDAKNEIKVLEKSLATLEATYKKGKVSITDYASESGRLRGKIDNLKAGIAGAEAAIQKYGSAQAAAAAMAKQADAASRSYGQGIMSASFAVQDFMSANGDLVQGLYRVQNNIPMILSQFGLGSGLAGVVSMASLGFGILLPHLVNAAKEMGLFGAASEKVAGQIEQLNVRIKELEDKPVKLAIDTFELDQAKKKLAELEAAARAFKQMGETQSPAEKASGEAISEKFSALGGAKGDQIQGDLKAKMAQELIAQSATIKAAEDEEHRASEAQRKAELRIQHSGSQGATLQALDDIKDAKARVKAAQDAAGKARRAITGDGGEAEREVGKIWADATKGNVEAQKKLVARLRAVGQEALASTIASLSPKLMEITPEDPEIARNNAFNEAAARKAREERASEDSRLAGAMTGSVGQKYLNSPGMDDASLQREVKTAMQKAGMSAKDIGEAMAGTAKKLRENLDKAVKDRALDRGISEGEARAQLAKEAQVRDDKQANQPKSEVMSTGSYLNKLLVASVSKPDQTAEKGLAAQQDTAKATMQFADLAAKWEARGIKVIGKDNPARVAPGR